MEKEKIGFIHEVAVATFIAKHWQPSSFGSYLHMNLFK